jgi:hypothetical protein
MSWNIVQRILKLPFDQEVDPTAISILQIHGFVALGPLWVLPVFLICDLDKAQAWLSPIQVER